MRSDADRVSDIIESIAKIRRRITGSVDAFQRIRSQIAPNPSSGK
jgi:hypothetical protein